MPRYLALLGQCVRRVILGSKPPVPCLAVSLFLLPPLSFRLFLRYSHRLVKSLALAGLLRFVLSTRYGGEGSVVWALDSEKVLGHCPG